MNKSFVAHFSAVFALLLMNCSAKLQGLELNLEREMIFVDNGNPCGHLTCLAKGKSVSIDSITLIAVNALGESNELLAVTTSKPEGEIMQDNVCGNGSLEKNLASIRLELSETTYCESSFFTCKVAYTKESGANVTTFCMAGPTGEPPHPQPRTLLANKPNASATQSPYFPNPMNSYSSEVWLLGHKITRVEGKFEQLSERLEKQIRQDGNEIRKRAGTLENRVLERVASVETDFSVRASRLEDRVSSILLSQSPSKSPDMIHAVDELERRLEDISASLDLKNETLHIMRRGEQEDKQPVICERGMAFDITKQYPPYQIMDYDGLNKEILCDTHTDGGGWIIIQRRVKGDIDFYRDWTSYRDGFGSLSGDFWLGNEAIHTLTDAHPYELRIDVRHTGQSFFAEYSSFRVTGEADNYRVLVGSYTGTLGHDSMAHHNKKPFSTFDRDNDLHSASCAVSYHGAWWYGSCHHAHLNGVWGDGTPKGAAWYTGSSWLKLYFTEMKIRRIKVNKSV